MGKLLSKIGRRNFLVYGSFIMFLSNFGFAAMHYIENTNAFIAMFVFLRIIQGIGTGCIQTANYAIVSVTYPQMIDFAVGSLEASAGIGLCFGPIIGILLFNVGGYVGSFSTFALIFLLFCFILKPFIPASVDVKEDKHADTSQFSYFALLSNRRILFANLAVIVNILQYTFIDPLLGDRMLKDFGYNETVTALMFFFLGLGYSTACQFVYKTLECITFRRCFFVFFCIMGFSTMCYGPIDVFFIPNSIHVVIAAMLI